MIHLGRASKAQRCRRNRRGFRSNVRPSGNAQRADGTAGMGLHNPCSPWRSYDSQLNVAHDGRLSALDARPAGLRTATGRAQREAGVDPHTPLRMLAIRKPI
jgi:hypothetical protein